MTDIVPADDIERIVGVPRSRYDHYGKAVSAEQRVYILHSQLCIGLYRDLRECPFSQALDLGIDVDNWTEDVPLLLRLQDDLDGFQQLVPDPRWKPASNAIAHPVDNPAGHAPTPAPKGDSQPGNYET